MLLEAETITDFTKLGKMIENVFPLLDPSLNFEEAKKRHL
jgi:hypothetical protein